MVTLNFVAASEPTVSEFKSILEARIVARHCIGEDIHKINDLASMPSNLAVLRDNVVIAKTLSGTQDWGQVLHAGKGLLRPGGRLFFSIDSQDFAPDVLAAFASASGLSLVAAIPFGAFLGRGAPNPWLAELEARRMWRRQVDLLSTNAALRELGIFLEENLVAHLPPQSAGSLMLVLTNAPDEGFHNEFVQTIVRREAALATNDWGAFFALSPLTLEQFAQGLEAHAASLRNRVFLYFLLRALVKRFPGIEIDALLSHPLQEAFLVWLENENTDRKVMDITRGWASDAEFRFRDGVDVTLGLEYLLIRDLELAMRTNVFKRGIK